MLALWRHRVRNVCFISLAVLYAPTMNFAFRSVLCEDTLAKSTFNATTVEWSSQRRSMLRAHPYYECGAGAGGARCFGLPVYTLAMLTLVCVGVLYPLSTFAVLLKLHRKTAAKRRRRETVTEYDRSLAMPRPFLVVFY